MYLVNGGASELPTTLASTSRRGHVAATYLLQSLRGGLLSFRGGLLSAVEM